MFILMFNGNLVDIYSNQQDIRKAFEVDFFHKTCRELGLSPNGQGWSIHTEEIPDEAEGTTGYWVGYACSMANGNLGQNPYREDSAFHGHFIEGFKVGETV